MLNVSQNLFENHFLIECLFVESMTSLGNEPLLYVYVLRIGNLFFVFRVFQRVLKISFTIINVLVLKSHLILQVIQMSEPRYETRIFEIRVKLMS